jgi:RNA-directed DNA polymerase
LAKDRILLDIGTKEQLLEWDAIDWQLADKRVKNLRQRIYRAAKQQQWNKARSLVKLMLRSYSNLLLAVRRVTQDNKGKRTAGVDRQLALTPKSRVKLVQRMLEHSFWAVRPTRRVFIPKANGQRPLGIPTIQNRIAQAVVKNALEPFWEARFEPNSYGFRPGRSCHDAIQQCWVRLNKHSKDRWILDADIKGAFDNISHDFIIKAIGFIPGRELVKQWLKAGYVETEIFHPTLSGTPQGGIVSPLLANIALDGMEQLLGKQTGFIRYADDFVVTAQTRKQIESVVPVLTKWLAERGLELHPDKTRIVSIKDGFNFLGFSLRHFHGKCLVQPQKDKVLKLLRDARLWLKNHKQVESESVIRHFNPILRGWCNYYRHAVSKETFAYVSHELWKALWRWCQRRHPKKGKDWVRRKYFGNCFGGSWDFQASVVNSHGEQEKLFLIKISNVSIVRHVKVKGDASPDDSNLREYWKKRTTPRTKRKAQVHRSERCRP